MKGTVRDRTFHLNVSCWRIHTHAAGRYDQPLMQLSHWCDLMPLHGVTEIDLSVRWPVLAGVRMKPSCCTTPCNATFYCS